MAEACAVSFDLDHWQQWRWEREDGRYYVIWLQQDLWGAWELHARWGGIDSRRRGEKVLPIEAPSMAEERIRKIGQRRRQHGYAPCGSAQ
ncbi:WGR domain-containing protein [Acidithiobacillus sp. VAN18-1]|uniref:WGR domain-containing protein n=1 Tax=Igneacidithiobacillus copahuensis TaxID=2724909 RepID=A0AAE2YQZ5_9PROT|nr:WGR domain-containing protein [Igneacidithiobacillus copahuensis]MBU2788348.1 WGR domain-containing protein [Igneacidithiobacillus copahuensis]MBU2795515.1 WGR domain-containing protein [Acidithiobacillus sp. VAN18-2]